MFLKTTVVKRAGAAPGPKLAAPQHLIFRGKKDLQMLE